MPLKSLDYLFVVIQFILFSVFLFDIPVLYVSLPYYLQLVGIAMAIAGIVICGIAVLQLNTNLSPFPTPKSGSSLIKNGVFTWVRHPIYSGVLLGLLGLSLYYQSRYKMGVVALLFFLLYFKTSYEEQRLETVFKEYTDYKSKTKRFIPFFL